MTLGFPYLHKKTELVEVGRGRWDLKEDRSKDFGCPGEQNTGPIYETVRETIVKF